MPIIWTRPDGSIAITVLVDAVVERERQDGESTAEVVTRLAHREHAEIARHDPTLKDAEPVLIRSANMPTVPDDSDCWVVEGDRVVVQQDKKRAKKPVLTLEDRVAALEAKSR